MTWNAPVYKPQGRKRGSKNKARPDFTVPEQLIKELSRESGKFANADTRHRLAAAHLICSRSTTGRYRHALFPDCFFIDVKELDALFGKGQFDRFNERVGMFRVYRYEDMGENATSGLTYAYAPTEWASEAVEHYLDSEEPTAFLDQRDRVMRRPRTQNVIPSRDKFGNDAAQNIRLRHFVPVNLDETRESLKRLDEGRYNLTVKRTQRDLERIRYQLRFVRRTAINNVVSGAIPQRYVEVESGRLYGTGFHLQNVKREVKRIALAGSWEYDFANSQFAIFEQLARQSGYEATTVQDYLANKTSVRTQLAYELGVSVEQAKELLLKILFGAYKAQPRSPNSSILALFEGDLGKAREAEAHPFVKKLRTERRDGSKAIIENLPTSRGVYKNACGKSMKGRGPRDELDRKTRSRLLAHVLQGAEAQALNLACTPLGDELLLLQHDGFATSERVDTAQIQQDIAVSPLGLRLGLEEEHLMADI